MWKTVGKELGRIMAYVVASYQWVAKGEVNSLLANSHRLLLLAKLDIPMFSGTKKRFHVDGLLVITIFEKKKSYNNCYNIFYTVYVILAHYCITVCYFGLVGLCQCLNRGLTLALCCSN